MEQGITCMTMEMQMQVLNIMTGMTTTTMALKNFNIIIEMLKKRRDVTKKKKKSHINTVIYIQTCMPLAQLQTGHK